MNIQFELIQHNSFKDYLDLIAAWRITYYREFPYLYVGNFEGEQAYLDLYQQEKLSSLFLAKYNQEIVGFTIGMPLLTLEILGEIFDINHLVNWLKQNNMSERSVYYFGEFMTHPLFRGKGICHQLLHQIEQFAIQNNFSVASLITVIRKSNHRLKNADYQEFNWEKTGFKKTGLVINSVYPTLLENGRIENTVNEMDFWIKYL